MCTRRHHLRVLVALVVITTAWTFTGRTSSGQADEPGAACRSHQGQTRKGQGDLSNEDRLNQEEEVLATLDKKIMDGRKKKGNKAIVDRLTAEKDDFEKDLNKVPPSLEKRGQAFFKKIRNAHEELAKAYERAIRDYTGAGKDAQADAIKSEQEAFRLKNATTIPYRREQEGPVEQPVRNVPVPRPLLFDPSILISSS